MNRVPGTVVVAAGIVLFFAYALYETQTPFEFRMPDKRLAGRTWAAGENFTLADCAGAPDRD